MSDTKQTITTEKLSHQVVEYTRQQPDYKTYADALKRVLEKACKTAFPEAFVQAREKAVTSFAEKCVRRFETYPDAVNQMTDLCGGRVIVQTLAQVKAVRRYIEANFTVEESDEKGLWLGTDKFGYRDMHYIVRLPMKAPEGGCEPGKKGASGAAAVDRKRAAALGFTAAEIKAIGGKRAEIQVRTWVQHAWADTLHDRMYKTSLKYPAGFKRDGNLLAAIMEEGDRAFDRLAGDIDGMLANFNAYASEDDVKRELKVQELILANAEKKKKPEIALRIARLLAPRGDFAGVVDRLAAHADALPPLGCAIRTELGNALCQLHRSAPRSAPYIEGQDSLREVVAYCRRQTFDSVPDLRRRTSTLARALARLAWSYEGVEEDAHLARDCYREALQLEPDNPYYLADVIGHEISWSKSRDFVGAMAAGMRQAIGTCLQHVRNGTEMPYAAFTAGRLHLLLDETHTALGCYARGIRHVLSGGACVPPDVVEAEEKWLILVTKPESLSGGFLWAMELLRLAGRLRGGAAGRAEGKARQGLKTPVLIVGGGAASLTPEQAGRLRPTLAEAFAGFAGTVFSGGTRVGVPGCVGAAADLIGPCGKRPFTLLGYLPRVRPDDAPEDERYDRLVKCGEQGFSAEQILRNWADILDADIRPDEVRLLGFGGGELSAAEYRIALGLGAWVGLVAGSGGAADGLIGDDLWAGSGNLLPIPCDPASVRALAHPPRTQREFDDAKIERMGIAFHEEYVRNSTSRLPDNMKPWKKLKDTFKTASMEQARFSVQILEACGFTVVSAHKPDKDAVTFTDEEVRRMAELEHGRWNVERLREGWRYAEVRDDAKKLHNCLLPWTDRRLDDVRHYDADSVRKFPEILAQAGLEVRRLK